jgi:hypothetical protein
MGGTTPPETSMFRTPLWMGSALLLAGALGTIPAWAGDDSNVRDVGAPAGRAQRTPERDSSPPTLFGGKGKPAIGGYGGVGMLGTRINGVAGVLVGGDAALLVDHRLALGLSGMGLVSDIQGPAGADGKASRLQFGYGGVFVEANLLGSSPVYFTVGGMVGAAGVAFCAYGRHHWEVECNENTLDESVLFVAEPRIGLRANVLRWLRLGVDARYRVVEGYAARGLDNGDFSGPSVGGSIEFGWF